MLYKWEHKYSTSRKCQQVQVSDHNVEECPIHQFPGDTSMANDATPVASEWLNLSKSLCGLQRILNTIQQKKKIGTNKHIEMRYH